MKQLLILVGAVMLGFGVRALVDRVTHLNAAVVTVTNASPVVTVNFVKEFNPKPLTINDDFVMGSETAVSNALAAHAPPEGWSVACDSSGHYAAHGPSGHVYDDQISSLQLVRTSHWEAVVSCWRFKEVADTVRNQDAEEKIKAKTPKFVWKDCE